MKHFYVTQYSLRLSLKSFWCWSSGHPPVHGSRVRLRVRAGAVPVAALAAAAARPPAHHLGLQDSVPRRALPSARQEDHIRGCGSSEDTIYI